jgi:hypothetical protein
MESPAASRFLRPFKTRQSIQTAGGNGRTHYRHLVLQFLADSKHFFRRKNYSAAKTSSSNFLSRKSTQPRARRAIFRVRASVEAEAMGRGSHFKGKKVFTEADFQLLTLEKNEKRCR